MCSYVCMYVCVTKLAFQYHHPFIFNNITAFAIKIICFTSISVVVLHSWLRYGIVQGTHFVMLAMWASDIRCSWLFFFHSILEGVYSSYCILYFINNSLHVTMMHDLTIVFTHFPRIYLTFVKQNR